MARSRSTSRSSGSIPHTKNVTRNLQIWDILIFTFIFMNSYLCRKLLYPFTKEFASFYNVPITSFSFVLSAFNIGGLASVLLTLLPSFHRIRIRLILFLLVAILSALYFVTSLCDQLSYILAIRMGMGFICKVISSEIRGILSVFTKGNEPHHLETVDEEHQLNNAPKPKQNSLAKRILFVETSWFSSSAGWIVIGVILHRFDVHYVWYFGSLCALIAALTCSFLPGFSVSDILENKTNSENEQKSGRQSIWTQCHLFWFIVGQFTEYFGYCAFMATFGPFLQSTYGLNAEELGFQTVFIAVAEGMALVVAHFTAKCRSHFWWIILSALIMVTAAAVFGIALWMGQVPIVVVWIMLFVYALWNEHAHLNGIVVVLEMTPRGLESKGALLSGFAVSLGSITGAIAGPHAIEWYGYQVVLMGIAVVQSLAIILWSISWRVFRKSQRAKEGMKGLLELDEQSHSLNH